MSLATKIYSKSTICDFVLMVNCNHGKITYRLRDSFTLFQSGHYRPLYSDCGLWHNDVYGNTQPYQRNPYILIAENYIKLATILSFAKWVDLHSFSRWCLPNLRNHTKFWEIRTNNL